jgi:hypothetical protein
MAPVIVWVVETGIPKYVTKNSVIAPPASAQKPCTGCSRVILDPIVRTMRLSAQRARAMTTTGKNRIMIYGPKDDGTYVVEFERPQVRRPKNEAGVIRHFQERMPYGLLLSRKSRFLR